MLGFNLNRNRFEYIIPLMKLTFTLFVLFLAAAWPVFSQDFKSFKNFSADHPLSYQAVRTISQDQDGFMWFGSQQGVHRYDGHQFLSFHHDVSNENSLSSDVISRILIDNSQQLWVATRGGGVNLFRENTKDFQRITTKSKELQLSSDNVNTLLEDSNGNLWIGTENGLNVLFRNGQKWQIKHLLQELGNPKSLANNIVETIIQTKSGDIWVGTNAGISVFDLQANFVQTIKLSEGNLANVSQKKLIKSLFQDEQKNIWIGTRESGLFKMAAQNNQINHYQFVENDLSSLISNSIESIYQDSANRVWIATDKGLMVYQQPLNNFTRIQHEITNHNSLTNDFVLTIFEDKNKIIWVGTFSGISRLDPNMTTFRQHSDLHHPEIASSLIMDFSQLNAQQLVFSTYANGIYILTTKTNQITPLKLNFPHNKLRFTCLLADGKYLWLGTRASGLFKVNIDTGVSQNFSYQSDNINSISANSITDIIKTKNGVIWVSTYHKGLNRLDKQDSFTRFESAKTLTNKSPSSDHILQLLADNLGYIWIATYGGGLNRFDPAAETFEHIFHDDNNKNSISSDFAWVMLQDHENNLWVGTQSAGINFLSNANIANNNFSFQHFDIKNGMKDQTVYGFSQDSVGKIWFSSNKGISRYSPKHNNFKHFDKRHGLIDMEYNHGAVFKANNNTIYFGSAKGFTSVNPQNIFKDQPAPEVRLTNILKLNEAMSFKQKLSTITELEFAYSDQLIAFEYVGLNFSAPESTRYKYRMQGFDSEWIDANKLRRATYTNLPAGNYRLQIIAGNNDNVWSSPGYSLNITVTPAPWNTWWAYLLYVIFIALALLSYTRILNRKLVIEQQQKNFLKKQIIDKTKDYAEKNTELEHANKQLEKAATVDKLTGVKSRRYLDIYIEQTSQLMTQMHQNILPVQRSLLPRLYILMIKITQLDKISNSELINFTDLLLYSRNPDDLVIRWGQDSFAIIGYEKDNNAGELAARLANRFDSIFTEQITINQVYSYYPFNREQPLEISWDQVSVLIELALKIIADDKSISWLGLCEPKVLPFDYLQVIKNNDLRVLKQSIVCKHN